MRNSQTNKSSDLPEKLNLNLINKWSATQGLYCILTMRLIILKTIKDKKGINKWCQLYNVLPISHFSTCSHQQCPFHIWNSLSRANECISQTCCLCCHWIYFILSKHTNRIPSLYTIKHRRTTFPWYQWTFPFLIFPNNTFGKILLNSVICSLLVLNTNICSS